MKYILTLILFLKVFVAQADILPVLSTSARINADKMNEIITKVNELSATKKVLKGQIAVIHGASTQTSVTSNAALRANVLQYYNGDFLVNSAALTGTSSTNSSFELAPGTYLIESFFSTQIYESGTSMYTYLRNNTTSTIVSYGTRTISADGNDEWNAPTSKLLSKIEITQNTSYSIHFVGSTSSGMLAGSATYPFLMIKIRKIK